MTTTIVVENLDLARKLARKAAKSWPFEPYDDLLQDARVGLVLAAKAYDPARGASFKTYAGWRIAGEVRHGIDRRKPKGTRRDGQPDMTKSIEALDDFDMEDRSLIWAPEDRAVAAEDLSSIARTAAHPRRLSLMAQGHTDTEVGRIEGVSQQTIFKYRQKIRRQRAS